MDSPGKRLKRERELQSLSVAEVSRSTRIKENFLRAIEEDRYDLCPPPFYVKGFLTNYARCLGLDPKDILLKYQDLMKPPTLPLEAALPERPGRTVRLRSPIPSRFLLFSALFISLLLPLCLYITSQPLKAPNLPSSSPKRPAPEVVHEREKRPVMDQIKQIELIGPKEVQAEPFYRVTDAHLGTGIETEGGRLAVAGKSSEFRCENQRVYFFTRVEAPKEGKIVHVWRWEGEEQHRIEMPVKSPSWSVYSYISLSPARAGNWKVEVWDGEKILTDLSFQVRS